MSLIYKCDVCGKDSAMKGIEFSQGPLMLKINNYNNEPMRVYVQVSLESESDYDKLLHLKEQLNELEPGITMEEAVDDPDFAEDFEELKVTLDNPFPMICNGCKKLLATDALRNATTPKQKMSYAKSSQRTKDEDKNLSELNIDETIAKLNNEINTKKGEN